MLELRYKAAASAQLATLGVLVLLGAALLLLLDLHGQVHVLAAAEGRVGGVFALQMGVI